MTTEADPAQERVHHRGRRLLAAVASAVLPGAGQLATGRRRSGAVLLLASVALLAVVVWLSTWPTTRLLGLLVRPEVLAGLFAANVAVAALRVFATADAYRTGRGRARRGRDAGQAVEAGAAAVWAMPRRYERTRRTAAGTALLLLLGVVVAPHAAAGYYTFHTRELLTDVFHVRTEPPTPSAPTVTPTPTPSVTPSPSPSVTPDPSPEPDATTPPATEEPEPDPGPVLGDDGVITIALLGSDAGPSRWSARTDTIIVASLDTTTGGLALFSVPRNLRGFPMPDALADVHRHHCPQTDGWELISALYTCAIERAPEEFAALYPGVDDPGLAALRDTLAEVLGIEVPYHAMVDMAGFVRLVDVLGGVDVDVSERIWVRLSPSTPGEPWRTFDIPAGRQRLSGEEALAFVRSRTGNSDYDRMRRQRCLIGSVASRLDPISVLRQFTGIADIIRSNVTTNVPLDALPQLVEIAALVGGESITTVGIVPPRLQRHDGTADLDRVHEAVRDALDRLASGETDPPRDAASLDGTCG